MAQKLAPKPRQLLGSIFLGAALLTGGCATTAPQKGGGVPLPQPPTTPQNQSPEETELREQLRVISLALQIAQKESVRPLTYTELAEAALKGMYKSIDPHSEYYTAQETKLTFSEMQGSFGGIGTILSLGEDKSISIDKLVDDAPAQKAGLMAGDRILKVDGAPLLSLEDAVAKMRGAPDTKLTLEIQRGDETTPRRFEITRAVVEIKTVKSQIIGGDVGYVSISSFAGTTTKDFEAAVTALKKDIKNPKGYILDLRNNPGGSLGAAIGVSDALLDQGDIVSIEDREKTVVTQATKGDVTDGKPVIVLINGNSASASEVVTGALQDNDRVTVIGTTSFGKGVVQTVLSLARYMKGRQDAVKLTTQYYLAPSGRSIQNVGIAPDILALAGDENPILQRREATLLGALVNPQNAAPPPEPKSECKATAAVDASKLEKAFVRADGKADHQLLCAAEQLTGKRQHTKVAPR